MAAKITRREAAALAAATALVPALPALANPTPPTIDHAYWAEQARLLTAACRALDRAWSDQQYPRRTA